MMNAAIRHRIWASAVASAAALGSACASGDEAGEKELLTEAAKIETTTGWTWASSRISGGGLSTQVAINPLDPSRVAAAGDVWGVYQSGDRGNHLKPALRGKTAFYAPGQGRPYFAGLAYSPTQPNTLYGLSGRTCGEVGQVCNLAQLKGAFVKITGTSAEPDIVLVNDSDGVGAGERKYSRHIQPRPLSRLVVTSRGGHDRLFAAMGSGMGIKRSADDGASWQMVWDGLNDDVVVTGIAFTSPAEDTLIVAVQGVNGGSYPSYYLLPNVHGALPVAAVPKAYPAGTMFNEVVRVGSNVFAAGKGGVYRSSDGGDHFVKVGRDAFGTNEVSAIAGQGHMLLAGCTAAGDGGPCLKKSINDGDDWTDATRLDFTVWGTTLEWWHGGDDSPGGLPTGNSSVINQIVMDPDFATNGLAYMAARGGPWKTADGGATWRPMTNGIGGSCTQNLGYSDGKLYVQDIDWNCFYGTIDQFKNGGFVHDQSGNACRGKTPVGECVGPSASCWTQGPVTFLPPTNSRTADITESGRSIATPFFQGVFTSPYAMLRVDANTVVISGNEGLVIGTKP